MALILSILLRFLLLELSRFFEVSSFDELVFLSPVSFSWASVTFVLFIFSSAG